MNINDIKKFASSNMYIRVWKNDGIAYEGRLDELSEYDNLSNESITKIACISSVLVIWVN